MLWITLKYYLFLPVITLYSRFISLGARKPAMGHLELVMQIKEYSVLSFYIQSKKINNCIKQCLIDLKQKITIIIFLQSST